MTTVSKPNSVEAKKIENNFLFIEWSENENNIDIGDSSIILDNKNNIRVKHLKTDSFSLVYQSIIDLALPCSLEDIVKVMNISQKIIAGGSGEIVKVIRDIGVIKGGNEISRNSVVALGKEVIQVEVSDVGTCQQVDVVNKVCAETNTKLLTQQNHRDLVNYFKVKGESDWDIENFNTNSTYCHYVIGAKKYLYTDQWIAFVVAVINAGKFQNAIADYKKNKNTKTIDGFLAEN
ncbi:MAG: hypothetical protein K2P98_02300 [Neisseriaceae bacterium]|nr:hypothetical protein [Neisseriaceae bacterium]